MKDSLSLPRCEPCNSPVSDSIEVEIENHGKVKLGEHTSSYWICNDCLAKRARAVKKSILLPPIRDDINNIHQLGAASKTDVSPNPPTADETDL